jgi:two-component system, OmpR family, alkaline phosphatase synthesis response regulator PhoP
MNKTILIIDKEIYDYHILRERLEQRNFIVHTTTDYQEGLKKVFKLKPDLIIYNFHLFLLSEKEFNGGLTTQKKYIPTIIVGFSNKEEDILRAFDMGADDYITKPFNSREVEARVKAILRRIEITKSTNVEVIKIGELVLKPKQYEIDLKTHKVNLSKREQQVLLLLIDRKVISREEIIRCLWGADYYGGYRIVDVNISNLRRKIEENPKKPQYIKTIKGYGYILDEPTIKEG